LLQCGTHIEKEDLIVINGREEDIKRLTEQLKRRKDRLKQEKKKKKKDAVQDAKCEEKVSAHGDQSSKNKRQNVSDCDKQTKKTKVNSEPTDSKNKFEDSNTYKKLFHKNIDKKDKAHWVTYNPYYN
jgi:hypothetical protein